MKQTVESYEQHGYSLKVKHFHGLLLHIHSSDGMAMRQKYYFQKGLPKEFKEAKGRKENSWIFCKIEDGEVSSYNRKTKSSGMRSILLLQTTNLAHYVTQDDKKASYKGFKQI